MKRIFLALLLVLGLGTIAWAAGAKFSIDKKLCLGTPASMADPSQCQEGDPVPTGVPVYYMITLTNPWSQPAQVISLTDNLPSQFTPTPTSVFCRDDANQPVVWTPNTAPNGFAIVNLAPAQTIHCFIPGTFTSDGKPKNEVEGKNQDNYQAKSDVTVDVPKTTPIAADLVIDKSVNPSTVNVSGGPQTVTYSITITNNGPGDVDIGDYFKLHDVMSLLPNSVPLNVQFVSANCAAYTASNAASSNTDCLDNSGPQFASGGGALFVGTMNQHNFFSWGFNNNGHITQGEKIVLTITVTVSAVDDLKCVRDPAVNGLANKAFFTLADKNNGALADANSANNTDSANLSVNVPYSSVDPDCAKGQLKVTKKQLTPPAGSQVSWGMPVSYEITIENVSLPAQQIDIDKHDLQDWVIEGINTPPFRRSAGKTYCDTAKSSPGMCNNFTPAGTNINLAGQYNYSYYGQANMGWDTDDKIKLPYGRKIVFNTTFIYDQPDCETVPEALKRPIINTARVTYKAPPFGAPTGTPDVTQTQTAEAETLMTKIKPCKFRVTKKLTSGGPNVQFGVPMTYNVTFTNLGDPRKIGTLFDAARITIPNYATQLPFTSSWKCTASTGALAVTGFNPAPGAIMAGLATYVGSGAQGAPAAITTIGSNIYFPTNGWISCDVQITVERPPVNDKFCTTQPAYFENVAMMDVTHPFNTNIAWPPTLGWIGTSMANPVPQNRNWASVRSLLPKCWDAHINKTATVGGLPAGSAPWTYPGNPNPVNYTISVTNDGDSVLGGPLSATDGWIVQDKFAPPYSSGTQQFGACTPGNWCWPIGPHNPKGQVGIRNLLPNQTGTWTVSQPGGAFPTNPVISNQDLRNCAWIKPVGPQTGAGWYNNQLLTIPSTGCPSSTTSLCPPGGNPLVACVTVPVIAVTKISVRKQVVDQTGAGFTASPANYFNAQVACTPYGIPTSAGAGSIGLTTGTSGYSPYSAVYPVPMGGTCTVSESPAPIPAVIASKCGGAANVTVNTAITPLPATLNPVNNPVTITNTYSCIGNPMGQLEVIKQLNTTMVAVQFPATVWTIDTNCTLPASASSLSLTTPASGNAQITASGIVTAPVGATCTVTEVTPSNALIPSWFKNQCIQQGGTAQWNAPQYSVNNGPATSTPPTVGINSGVQTVRVINGWSCVPNGPPNGQIEVIKELQTQATVMQFPATAWTINANCIPAASSNVVTLNTATSGNSVLTTSGFVTAQVGANCTISEVLPPDSALPTWAKNGCTTQSGGTQSAQWNAPQYSVNFGAPSTTAPNMTVTSGIQTVKIINSWSCKPTNNSTVTFQYQMFKRVVGPTMQVPAMTFQINPNCSLPSTPTSTSATASGSSPGFAGVVAITTGASCNFTEVMPDPKQIPAMVAYCSAQAPNIEPKWLPPTFSYSSSGSPTVALPLVVISAQNLFITNTWTCGPPATGKVAPKKKPRFRINIGIPIPGIGGGGKKQDGGDTRPPPSGNDRP